MSHASLRNYVHTLRTLANTWPSPFRSSFSLELTAAIEKRVHQTESRRGRGRALPYPSSDPQSLAFTEKKSLSCLYVFFDLCYHWRIPLIGTKHERLFGKRGKISPPLLLLFFLRPCRLRFPPSPYLDASPRGLPSSCLPV